MFKKNQKVYKETGKHGPFKGEKKSIETVSEKDLMIDLLGKDFKITMLKVLTKLKKDMKTVQKTMHE